MAGVDGPMELDEAERWFGYRDNRNTTAHDDGVWFARETTQRVWNPHRADCESRFRTATSRSVWVFLIGRACRRNFEQGWSVRPW